jgi:hypothetical protein
MRQSGSNMKKNLEIAKKTISLYIMKEQLGKYCLDLSKLVFGGAIISAIMKESISLFWVILLGGAAVVVLAIAGFLLIKNK